MNNKEKLAITIIMIAVGVLIGVFFISKLKKPTQVVPSTPATKNIPEVTIVTDKKAYNKGEKISIVIENGLEKEVLHYAGDGRVWGIEYFESGEWKKFGYGGRGGFQLTDETVGEKCYLAQYERDFPIALKSQANITASWKQKICPFAGGDSNIAQYMDSGEYRFAFSFGFELKEGDQFLILDPKTVYSNTFTLR